MNILTKVSIKTVTKQVFATLKAYEKYFKK
jgi:hypothetical protein